MAKQTINIGLVPNDGTGDTLRVAGDKINDNFDEVYNGTASVVRTTAPPTLVGETGDISGMIAIVAGAIYACDGAYDGSTIIWTKSTDHTILDNIGTNTHAQIDTHIADATLHFTEGSISITESQISDLQSYSLTTHNHIASEITSGTFADAFITVTSVTQHQASLSITESQVSDLQSYSLTTHNHDADYLETRFILKAADFTAVTGKRYLANTTGGGILVTLPGSLTIGDNVYFFDSESNFTTNPLTVGDAADVIDGVAGPKIVNVNDTNFGLVWTGDEWKTF